MISSSVGGKSLAKAHTYFRGSCPVVGIPQGVTGRVPDSSRDRESYCNKYLGQSLAVKIQYHFGSTASYSFTLLVLMFKCVLLSASHPRTNFLLIWPWVLFCSPTVFERLSISLQPVVNWSTQISLSQGDFVGMKSDGYSLFLSTLQDSQWRG